jgi:hypothetical protein
MEAQRVFGPAVGETVVHPVLGPLTITHALNGVRQSPRLELIRGVGAGPDALKAIVILGERFVPPFVPRRRNSTASIRRLTEINGRSIALIEADLRRIGALSDSQGLIDALARHNDYVRDHGFDHFQLGDAVRAAMHAAMTSDPFTLRGESYEVEIIGQRGMVESPFEARDGGNSFYRVTGPRGELRFHGILRGFAYNGFYMDELPPEQIIHFFGLKPRNGLVESAPVVYETPRA